MDSPKEAWDLKTPADLTKRSRRPRSSSPTGKSDRHQQQRSRSLSRRRKPDEKKKWNEPPRIICVSPKIVPNRNPDDARIHCLDSIHIRRLFPERPVMTRPVNHVASHAFDTCDYKTAKNETAILDTNAFCRSIAFQDPNTRVHHIISFENFYDFCHEFEEADPEIPVDVRHRPKMEIEKQVLMSVQIVSPEQDKQLSENKFLYSFEHKIRVYCPHSKLQTWATTFKPSEIIDYCDVDPYLSASTCQARAFALSVAAYQLPGPAAAQG